MREDLYGLLIAGGAGTRLWPLSRRAHPKQLLPLSGGPHSLLQDAFRRLTRTVAPGRVHAVTSSVFDAAVYGQIAELAPGYARGNVLAEPYLRDSAPAVLWGALRISHHDPEAVTAVLWTDQRICNEDAFDAALRKAYDTVRDGGLAAIGVPANRPSTTLGYIRMGPAVGDGVYEAERFVEKPDRATAERLVAEGRYLWNPGVFVFKVRTLLEEFERFAPAVMGHFREQARHLRDNDWSDPALIEAVYARLSRESIDYLILEQTERLLLIPTDLDWSDLGTWDELYFQAAKDEQGNAVTGHVLPLDTHNTYIRGGKRLIATVGVENLVVIDTDDALLICDLSRVQDIKRLVELLSERGLPQVESFGESAHPWGTRTVLQEGTECQVSLLEVRPRQQFAPHAHCDGARHWVVLEGRVRFTQGAEILECGANEPFHVPPGGRCRLENAGDDTARLIEVGQGTDESEADEEPPQDGRGHA